MKPDRSDPYDSVKSLAARWNVSERTIHRLIKKGDLQAIYIGDQLRISPEVRNAYERRPGT